MSGLGGGDVTDTKGKDTGDSRLSAGSGAAQQGGQLSGVRWPLSCAFSEAQKVTRVSGLDNASHAQVISVSLLLEELTVLWL